LNKFLVKIYPTLHLYRFEIQRRKVALSDDSDHIDAALVGLPWLLFMTSSMAYAYRARANNYCWYRLGVVTFFPKRNVRKCFGGVDQRPQQHSVDISRQNAPVDIR